MKSWCFNFVSSIHDINLHHIKNELVILTLSLLSFKYHFIQSEIFPLIFNLKTQGCTLVGMKMVPLTIHPVYTRNDFYILDSIPWSRVPHQSPCNYTVYKDTSTSLDRPNIVRTIYIYLQYVLFDFLF